MKNWELNEETHEKAKLYNINRLMININKYKKFSSIANQQ